MEPTQEQRDGQARYLLKINLEQYLFHGENASGNELMVKNCRAKYGEGFVLGVLHALTQEYRGMVPPLRLNKLWTW